MNYLVKQHCNGCGKDYFTSRLSGDWKRIDAATRELTLRGRPCIRCRGEDVSGPTFDNAGMLLVEEEVAV